MTAQPTGFPLTGLKGAPYSGLHDGTRTCLHDVKIGWGNPLSARGRARARAGATAGFCHAPTDEQRCNSASRVVLQDKKVLPEVPAKSSDHESTNQNSVS